MTTRKNLDKFGTVVTDTPPDNFYGVGAPSSPSYRSGRGWRSAVQLVYPLDLSGAKPAFAYGAKKLTASYNGPALRIVRASDNATQDIEFNGQNIDKSAVDAFLTGTSGKVDIWYDQSGNGNHATQVIDASRPLIDTDILINGTVVPIFNVSKMTIPNTVTGNRNAVHWFGVLEPLFQITSALIQLGSGANQFSLYEQINHLDGNGMPSLANKPVQMQTCLYEAQGNGTVGIVQQDGDSSTGAITNVSLAGGQIGNTSLAGGYDGRHYAGAQIGFLRALSSTERSALRGALQTLFNSAPDVVSKRVIFCGDSITAVTNPANANYYGFAKMVERSLPSNVAMYNCGHGGAQIQNDLATYATTGAGYVLQKYTDSRVVQLFYGTNDLTLGARTAAQIYADIQTYCANIRADGGKVIVTTLLPNNVWTTAQQTTRNDLNTLLRANWASFADGLCDFALNAIMGPQVAASNPNLYPDGLHPSKIGHAALVPTSLAAIQALL